MPERPRSAAGRTGLPTRLLAWVLLLALPWCATLAIWQQARGPEHVHVGSPADARDDPAQDDAAEFEAALALLERERAPAAETASRAAAAGPPVDDGADSHVHAHAHLDAHAHGAAGRHVHAPHDPSVMIVGDAPHEHPLAGDDGGAPALPLLIGLPAGPSAIAPVLASEGRPVAALARWVSHFPPPLERPPAPTAG